MSNVGLRAIVLRTPRGRRIDRLTVRAKLKERLLAMTPRAQRPSILREGRFMRD